MEAQNPQPNRNPSFAELALLVGMQIAFSVSVALMISFFPAKAESYLWSGVLGILLAGRAFVMSQEKKQPASMNHELNKRFAAWGLLSHVGLGALVGLALYLRAPRLFDFLKGVGIGAILLGAAVGLAVDFSVSFWSLEVGTRRAQRLREAAKDREK